MPSTNPTSFPLTLRAIAGAPDHAPDPDQAAIVLIDAQREYLDGALPLHNVSPAIAASVEAVEWARSVDIPVIHVWHHAAHGSLVFNPNGPGTQPIPGLEAMDGEAVIIKRLPNSFAGTGLLDELNRMGRRELILMGFMTHMCVSTTARAALDHGFSSHIIASATATRDLPVMERHSVIPADLVQAAALAALADRFATVWPDLPHLIAAMPPASR